MPEIILASGSPRRRELLAAVKIPFRVVISHTEEEVEGLAPEALVVELARRKARDAAVRLLEEEGPGSRLVIGADTLVICAGKVLGKPRNQEHAREMLQLLSGREHTVITGLALLLQQDGQQEWAGGCERTRVQFGALGPDEIESYVRSQEPMDKAGAYGIQGCASFFVEGITGCYFNVVGLPLRRLYILAHSLGVDLLPHP